MTSLIREAYHIFQRDGLRELVYKGPRFLYRKMRMFLPPSSHVRYNGVAIDKRRRFGDKIAPLDPDELDDEPGYKSSSAAMIRGYIQEDDHVIVIGGGWGVTAVIAAKSIGDSGNVIVYEPSNIRYGRTKAACKLNHMRGSISVKHAFVGPLGTIDEGEVKAPQVSPAALPEHDVLQLDCEGAEAAIVSELENKPRMIIVETHGFRGTSTAETKQALRAQNYNVKHQLPLDVGIDYSKKKDAFLLVALLNY